MQVTVFGASGRVGKQLTTELLAQGHTVVACVHSNRSSLPKSSHLRILTGDIHDSDYVVKAIAGSDAIISALGSWGTKSKDIVSSATEQIIPAMNAAKISRYISVTGNVAVVPGENIGLISTASRFIFGIIAGPILRDGDKHLAVLHSSNLNWTAFRSPPMTGSSSTKYKLSLIPLSPFAVVSRKAVVKAMIDALTDAEYSKQAPFIVT